MDANVPIAQRSIPACAGEPDSRVVDLPIQQVYPRVCGGTRGAAAEYNEHVGLSPRVRGNLDDAWSLER